MAVRQIVFSNESILHEPSRPVRRVDQDVLELVEDMIETMHSADGIGLAAVQIGVPERVVVIELPGVCDEEEAQHPAQTEIYALINPELVNTSDELAGGIEGCLSVPGWVGEVERHQAVTVEALDLEGYPVRIRAEGLLARVVQHEIDHCRGVLFIDHIKDPEKIWRVEEGQEEAIEAAQDIST